MVGTNFNTRNDTYRKLMGNGLTYRVPRFQRDYSWGEEEWDDLWHDILGTLDPSGEPAHYMGYLVLQSKDDREFDIIDGQQRLTTLSILVLAALLQLKKLIKDGKDVERTQQRIDGLRHTYIYIGFLDPVTLVPQSKLTLNRYNDSYFQTYLVPLADHLPKRGFKASEHSLRKAFEWFDRRIREFAQDCDDRGLTVASLVERMSDKLFFTVITVTDELNAYKVFETLNARGVRLSATDLLKNYLFSLLHREGHHEHELTALEDRWEQIIGRLGAESFPDFLRMHWISRWTFVRQSDLFKTIRQRVTDRREAFTLLQDMEEDMDTYLALTQPDASSWKPELREFARHLRMFSVRQPLPLLLAAHRQFGDSEFAVLLRAIVMISFRYNVISNFQTSEQERRYHASASRIAKGSDTSVESVLSGLRSVYPSDDQFRAAFADKSISVKQSRNRRVVRYILARLESQASGNCIDFESNSISLEHICPTNPSDGWDEFTDEDIGSLTSRIGNLLLLETRLNRGIGNLPYSEKRVSYAKSAYHSPRDLAVRHTDWTPSRIEARQQEMARTATAIWRVSQLS